MEPIHTQTPSLRDQAQFIPCLCRPQTPHGAQDQDQAQAQAPPPPAPVAKEAREAVARGSHVTTSPPGRGVGRAAANQCARKPCQPISAPQRAPGAGGGAYD